jgi:hypothetical protein
LLLLTLWVIVGDTHYEDISKYYYQWHSTRLTGLFFAVSLDKTLFHQQRQSHHITRMQHGMCKPQVVAERLVYNTAPQELYGIYASWATTPSDTLAVGSTDQEEDEEYLVLSTRSAFTRPDLPHGALMSTKVPLAFDGRGSWFASEEMVQDWEDSFVLGTKSRGPALKLRLTGEAAVFKPTLNRNRFKDENEGVEYFLNTMGLHLINSA